MVYSLPAMMIGPALSRRVPLLPCPIDALQPRVMVSGRVS